MGDIANNLRRLANPKGGAESVNTVCKVTAVDTDKLVCDCEPVNGDAPFFDVRIKSAVSGSVSGFVVIPKKDSHVIVSVIGNNLASAYVSNWDEIDEVWVEISKGFYIKIKNKGIEINGDSYSLIKDDELKSELKKYTQILQAIMLVINGAPLTQPANSPSVLQAAIQTAIAGKQLPTFVNITNDNVKHG